MDDYFNYGPVDDGSYNKSRSRFDKALGWLDGLSGLANSAQRTSGSLADISEDFARGARAQEDRRADRDARELDLLLKRKKVSRGDNIQLYWAGAIALGVTAFLLVR